MIALPLFPKLGECGKDESRHDKEVGYLALAHGSRGLSFVRSTNGRNELNYDKGKKTVTPADVIHGGLFTVAAPELSAFSPPPSVKARVRAATSTWEKRITNQEMSWDSCLLLAALRTAVFLGLRFTRALYTITTFLFLISNAEIVRGREEYPQNLTLFAREITPNNCTAG